MKTHDQAGLVPVNRMLALGLFLAPALQSESPEWRYYTPGNTGIPGDTVVTIHVDADDDPWIAGYTTFWEQGGMAHWDGAHWSTLSNVERPEIVSPRFYDIVEDAAGRLWIATEDGVLHYDPVADSLTRYDTTNTPLPAVDVVDLALDPEGSLWLAVDDNETGIGGLARFVPSTGSWSFWDTTNGLPWGAEWPGWDTVDFVAAIPSPAGGPNGFAVWFGSGPMGMATWENGSFSWFGLPNPSSPTLQPIGFAGRSPVDELGNAWMVTSDGLARRNPDGTFLITGYPAGLSTEVSVVNALSGGRAALGTYYADVFVHDGGWLYRGDWGGSATYVLDEDSTGALWAGGLGGSAKLSAGAWQRYRLTNTGMLGYFMNTLDFDAAGNVYMNGNAGPGVGGFTIFDGEDWTCVNDFNYGLGPAWGLPSDDVEVLRVRANGNVALAPGGIQGMLEWDGSSYETLIPQGFSIVAIEEDSLGRLWAAEDYGYAVSLVEANGTTRFTPTTSPLPAGDVDFIVADRSLPGYVWIFAAAGFALTNGVDWNVFPREVLGLTQNSIGYFLTCGDQAPDGTLWIGTGRGVFHFDPLTSEYTQYTPAQTELPSDEAWQIEVAPDGTVWISTFDSTWPYPGGLTHFDGSTWTTYSAGLSPLPHNQLAALESRPVRGGYELWVATASEGVAVLTMKSATSGPRTRPTGETLRSRSRALR